ncbi:sulfatase-like hydrolase/transferase [Lysinibacillus sp. NPDC097162]|uniref:sulfatase-like hydrolase/transferase n=1 Tax=Lysinibacillus sp. NPDC097162 TaxID=3364140 RepID=UPI0038172B11
MKNAKITSFKKVVEEISFLLNEGLLAEAKEKLDGISIRNESYYSLFANYYYLINEFQQGITLLEEEALKEFPFSFEIVYNLATLKSAVGELIESLWMFARCVNLAGSDNDREIATKHLDQVIVLLKEDASLIPDQFRAALDYTEMILLEGDERTYPVSRFNESLVKKVVKDSAGNEFLTEMYKSMNVMDIDTNSRYFFKTELLQGKTTNSFSFEINNETTLPISLFGQYDDIEVQGPKSNYLFPKNVLSPNQFNYFTFNDVGEYKVTSNRPFFIAKPINMKPILKTPQIIITIFVDGLANSVIEEKLHSLMPHTYNFFSNGYINNNCYTTGDWTLPSVASMYTGKTTLHHGLYHPSNHFELNKYNHLFTKDFQKNGYLTAQINNDWRVTPTYGYLEGMDRILYQNYAGGFTAGEVVVEAIEHLETFKNNNHFLWISLMDLHDVADEINNDLMSQVNVSAKYRQNKNLGATSVLSSYDPNKLKKYESELKRVDLHLSSLYSYLESSFGKENIIVALVSDHGQTYLKEDDFLLHEPRRKVPFMLGGANIERKVSYELCSIIDIFPTISKLADIKAESYEGVVLKDFGGIGRDTAITETIHPNQPYLVAITDTEHIFRFKTKSNVSENGLVDLEHYEAQLLDIKTFDDVSVQFKEKLEIYIDTTIQRAIKLQP